MTGTFNASAHQDISEKRILLTLLEQFGDDSLKFQNDSAPVSK